MYMVIHEVLLTILPQQNLKQNPRKETGRIA